MGELPCLRRSFSQPSGGFREAKEGDPFRALGESVSFGRFLTDSLAWERWSAFSHNRYLEEVEKFAKPGSVAEKKAYFEAHYKRKAAERAAALLEAANVVTTSNVVEQPATEDKKRNDSLMESDMVKGEIDVGEQQDKDVASNVTICPSNSNLCVERNEPDVSELEGGGGGVAIQESMDVESSNPVEISIPPENNVDLNKIESTTEENMLGSEEARDQEIIASASKKRSSSSSSKSTSQNKAYKTLLSPAKQMTHVQTTKANNLASRSKNFVEDMVNKKNAKSLHMSIHFSSHSGGESSKTTSPIIQKIKSLKNFTASLSVSKNNSASSQTKTKASVNELKRPSLNLKSEDRSNRPMLNKSVAGGIIADQKRNSPSKENSKSPNGQGSKPRSSLITSPFSLRSEERAAKRKEFYEKLEQKRKAEKVEKKHLQKRYQDVKKVQQRTSSKAKPNEGLCPGSQLSTSHIKKIPPTQPRSPLLGRKTTTSKISDATSRSLANTESSKCIENKRSTNWPVTSRLQKNARENASPNIQSSALKR